MKRIRTFVAIDLSPAVRHAAERTLQDLRHELSQADVHWVAGDLLHVTLKFVGNVDESELPEVCRIVARACGQTSPFELHCRGLDAFPCATRARTIWLGVAGDGLPALNNLQREVETGLSRAGFPREIRRYAPHITLGRVRGQRAGAEVTSALHARADVDLGRFTVDRVTTFASRLARGGPTYMPLGHVPLPPHPPS